MRGHDAPTDTTTTRQPLLGRRIVVTRAAGAGDGLAERLRDLGAEPLHCPTIAIAPPADTATLDAALAALDHYAWVALTSANAAEALCDRLQALGRGIDALDGVRVAVVGPGTAATLAAQGREADCLASVHTAEALAVELPLAPGDRVLLPVSDLARPTLADGLRARGAAVDVAVAYRTVEAAPEAGAAVVAGLRAGTIDALTFTSPSTVRGFLRLLAAAGGDFRELARRPLVACIGPVTAAAARDAGLPVDAVAREHSVEGLVGAVADLTPPPCGVR